MKNHFYYALIVISLFSESIPAYATSNVFLKSSLLGRENTRMICASPQKNFVYTLHSSSPSGPSRGFSTEVIYGEIHSRRPLSTFTFSTDQSPKKRSSDTILQKKKKARHSEKVAGDPTTYSPGIKWTNNTKDIFGLVLQHLDPLSQIQFSKVCKKFRHYTHLHWKNNDYPYSICDSSFATAGKEKILTSLNKKLLGDTKKDFNLVINEDNIQAFRRATNTFVIGAGHQYTKYKSVKSLTCFSQPTKKTSALYSFLGTAMMNTFPALENVVFDGGNLLSCQAKWFIKSITESRVVHEKLRKIDILSSKTKGKTVLISALKLLHSGHTPNLETISMSSKYLGYKAIIDASNFIDQTWPEDHFPKVPFRTWGKGPLPKVRKHNESEMRVFLDNYINVKLRAILPKFKGFNFVLLV